VDGEGRVSADADHRRRGRGRFAPGRTDSHATAISVTSRWPGATGAPRPASVPRGDLPHHPRSRQGGAQSPADGSSSRCRRGLRGARLPPARRPRFRTREDSWWGSGPARPPRRPIAPESTAGAHPRDAATPPRRATAGERTTFGPSAYAALARGGGISDPGRGTGFPGRTATHLGPALAGRSAGPAGAWIAVSTPGVRERWPRGRRFFVDLAVHAGPDDVGLGRRARPGADPASAPPPGKG